MVAQASRPLAGSLAQNLAHCGSGDTRSTFEGGAGWAGAPGAAWPGAAGAPGAGFAGVCCADAPPASATLSARAAALARMTWNLINRPFELLNGIVLRFVLPVGARNWRRQASGRSHDTKRGECDADRRPSFHIRRDIPIAISSFQPRVAGKTWPTAQVGLKARLPLGIRRPPMIEERR